jgi:flavin reductase (DIM6/NTAB) family NADH-FMN oxidoreductase RutF
MKEIDPQAFETKPVELFDKAALLLVESGGVRNAMAIAWGGLGVLWSRPALTVYVRDSRYTHELMETCSSWSVNFFAERRDLIKYFGMVSGRDEDKIAKSGLRVEKVESTPIFPEADLVIVARKLIGIPLPDDKILDPAINERLYMGGGFHSMYSGEILKILSK